MLDIGAVMALKEHRQRDVLRLAGASAKRRANLGGGAPSFVISDFSEVVAEARAVLEEQDGPGAADEAFAEGELLDDVTLAALLGGPMSPDPVTNS
jgi:hypothetical protein